MAYRRFKLPEISLTPATVATLQADEPQTVATVASVAGPELVSEPLNAQSVAGAAGDFAAAIPATYRDAFADLCGACPAGVPEPRWRHAIADAERFLAEWGETAERLGW